MKIKLQSKQDVYDFVSICNAYSFDIDARTGHYVIDAKSVLGVLSIGFGVELDVICPYDSPMKDEFYRELDPWKVA